MPANQPPEESAQPDIFDEQAEQYDAWHDAPPGATIFANELDAIKPLLEEAERPWLEVGVGTGRFAAALGVDNGVDPAPRAIKLASGRGVDVALGRAENLPYPDGQFGAVLFIVALCFVNDPATALAEARRVLRRKGALILGVIPCEGPWAKHYQMLASEGDPYFQRAHFFSRDDLNRLLGEAGFRIERIRTTLFQPPREEPAEEPAREGDDLAAGFLAILATPG